MKAVIKGDKTTKVMFKKANKVRCVISKMLPYQNLMSVAFSLGRMGLCDLRKSIRRVNSTPQNSLRIWIIKMMKT